MTNMTICILLIRKTGMMTRLITVLSLIAFALGFSSCKIIKSIHQLKKKHAKVYSYKLGNKAIDYCPLHHLGKKEFYDDVTRVVTEHKKDGYVVYYEMIRSDFTKDSLLKDSIRRKARKLKGFSGSYKENSRGMFKKYIEQPQYKNMGVTDNDVWADINYLQMINQFEKLYGEIRLDSADMNTPFDAKFNKSEKFTKQQYNSIVIDYRNDHLIELIKESKPNKILVLYGEGHRKNFKQKIKKIKG